MRSVPGSPRVATMSRAVIVALALAGFMLFFVRTLNIHNMQSCSSGVQWRDLPPAAMEVGAEAEGNSVPLSVYPGRKPKTVSYLLHEAKTRYMRMMNKREEMLRGYGYGQEWFDPWHNVGYWWLYFPATFACPHEIQRIGPMADGGKWVCGMSLYEEEPKAKCIIYSLGVNVETRFEGEMMDKTDCEIWVYDASVTDIGPESRGRPKVHFYPIFVGDENKVDSNGKIWKTLRTLMKENGHDWIDILKIDIGGYEYQTFDAIMDDFTDTLPFSQLLMKFHVMDPALITFDKFLLWWMRLESFGVYPWWTEVNLKPALINQKPWASEYCFLNTQGGAKNILIQNY